MSSSKYIFTLDLRSVQSQISLPVTQGDTNRTLIISFSDGAKPYVLGEKATAMLSILRPTGTPVQEYCEVEKDGSCATYNFSEYTVAVAGLHKCQLVLYNAEGKQIASPKFSIDAAPKLVTGDDVVIPDDEVIALDAIYTAEAKRASAEMSRAEAEAQRVSAEAARKEASEKAINDLNTVKSSIEQMRDNGDFDGKDGKDGKDGEKGATGETGAQGPQGVQGIQGPPGPQGETGPTGPQGPKGDGFSIEKTYSSISAMNAGFATDGVSINALVLINTGNVADVDNAKLYIKRESGYSYLTDLSGAQGIQGPAGPQGATGPQGPQGNPGPQGVQGNPGQAGVGIAKVEKTSSTGKVDTYAITLTNNAVHYFTVTNGTDGSPGTSVTVTKVVESTEDGGVNVVTLSNGQTINIKNGSRGRTGATGATGPQGPQGPAGGTGPQGETGATGPQGPQGPAGNEGKDGANGKDGSDYILTDDDKDEIKDKVIARVPLVKAPEAPIFVDSLDKMTDTSKVYGYDGKLYAYITRGSGLVPNFTNLYDVKTMNNDTYIPKRVNSSGNYVDAENYYSTPFLELKNPVPPGGVATLYTAGCTWRASDSYARIGLYPAAEHSDYIVGGNTGPNNSASGWTHEVLDGGIDKWTRTNDKSRTLTHVRFTIYDITNVETTIITSDEEITYREETISSWTPVATYTANLCTDIVGVVGDDNVIYVSSNNLPSGTYTLKAGDGISATTGTITV